MFIICFPHVVCSFTKVVVFLNTHASCCDTDEHRSNPEIESPQESRRYDLRLAIFHDSSGNIAHLN